MDRPCEVWMTPRDENARRTHQQAYGHAVHECVIERPFAVYHDSDHRCKCGITWPQHPSDDNPVAKPEYDVVNVWVKTADHRPPKEGYYLAAWNRHGNWVVSELWYNPHGIGPGWWTARRYLMEPGRTLISNDIDVEAWMYMPEYKP